MNSTVPKSWCFLIHSTIGLSVAQERDIIREAGVTLLRKIYVDFSQKICIIEDICIILQPSEDKRQRRGATSERRQRALAVLWGVYRNVGLSFSNIIGIIISRCLS